jgi:hypothetical protein
VARQGEAVKTRDMQKFRVGILGAAALLFAVTVSRGAEWKVADLPLSTQWTSQVGPDNALPEYPRPQMVRKAWSNLNGLWDYAVAPREAAQPSEFEGKILVPFPIESGLSGVKRALDPSQRLWYRRTFKTEQLKGKHLLLHFGAVDWRAEVFVNGTRVGEHEGGYDPFTFDITSALKPDASEQEIVVSVWDPTDESLHPRGKQVLKPGGIFYTAVSGIWQTVWLEPVRASYISEISMISDVDGHKLRLLIRGSEESGFTATAKFHGRTVGRISGKTGTETAVPIKDLRLWSPDTPVLYDLKISLKTGDTVTSYFGMRKVAIAKDAAGYNRIFLNNKAQFLIGPLDQGWWPDGLYTAATDDAIRFDIQTLKKLGFNMLRKHVKVEPARYYYWCDKLGLAVWQDMPSAMTASPETRVKKGSAEDATFPPADAEDFQRELKAMIHNLTNVPSIIAWVPFNEGWGEHSTNEILKMVKAMDPSRLVDGPSGWEDRGYGDMKDMHSYPGPGMFPVMPDRASVLGEFGGLAHPVTGHLWTDKHNWGYRTYQDQQGLQAAYESLIAQLNVLARQGLSAAVYTQTSDVESEINGLMTYDRRVLKVDADRLAKLHRELIEAVGNTQ